MTHSIHWGADALLITYTEKTTFAEFMEVVQKIHASPDYKRVRSVIHDMQATEIDVADANVSYLAAHELGARFTNPHVKLALVTSHPVMLQLAQEFRKLTNLEVSVFEHLDDATHWSKQTDRKKSKTSG